HSMGRPKLEWSQLPWRQHPRRGCDCRGAKPASSRCVRRRSQEHAAAVAGRRPRQRHHAAVEQLPPNRQKDPVDGHAWPDSLDELANVVQEAERLGAGVRAVGSSWSNSDVAVAPAYVVETDKLNGVLTNVL